MSADTLVVVVELGANPSLAWAVVFAVVVSAIGLAFLGFGRGGDR